MAYLGKLFLRLTVAAIPGLAALSPIPAMTEEITLKVWSRADRTGPLRAGNIVKAARFLSKQLAAAKSGISVRVTIFVNNAKGYNDDALDLLRACAVDKCPDVYVAAHEWIGAFVEAGYAKDLEAHIAAYPELYSDVIPVLWEATKFKGRRYAIPQDTEIRMFFYSKAALREIGRSEKFIEGLPGMVERGEFTIWDLSKLAKEVVEAGVREYGIVHRPNVGPDFLMLMASFGFKPYNAKTGRLQASRSSLKRFLEWIAWNAKNGVTPRNNTAMSWDTINSLLPKGRAFAKLHGVWDVPRQIRIGGWQNTAKDYFRRIGWLHAPPAKKGGTPANLSHPIVYLVNPRSPHAELAALLVGLASQPYFNTGHAVTTSHIAIQHGQTAMPAYRAAWSLLAATPMLKRSTFLPNHVMIGQYNAVIYKGIQGVETGRLSVEKGVNFIIDELQAELGGEVDILD